MLWPSFSSHGLNLVSTVLQDQFPARSHRRTLSSKHQLLWEQISPMPASANSQVKHTASRGGESLSCYKTNSMRAVPPPQSPACPRSRDFQELCRSHSLQPAAQSPAVPFLTQSVPAVPTALPACTHHCTSKQPGDHHTLHASHT